MRAPLPKRSRRAPSNRKSSLRPSRHSCRRCRSRTSPAARGYEATTTDPYEYRRRRIADRLAAGRRRRGGRVDSYDDGYDPQAYTQFQSELAPYGDWIDDASYGRVWTPNDVARRQRLHALLHGRPLGADRVRLDLGVRLELGLGAVSLWPLDHRVRLRLGWVPGTMWGPAWVAWRYGGGCVGWAALPPRGVSVTTTYGHRSPWRFTRANDLGVGRPAPADARHEGDVPPHQQRRQRPRVVARGKRASTSTRARVHPGATVARLKTVAPHTLPQRAILPRPGASMSARPWIRAAAGGGGGAPSRRRRRCRDRRCAHQRRPGRGRWPGQGRRLGHGRRTHLRPKLFGASFGGARFEAPHLQPAAADGSCGRPRRRAAAHVRADARNTTRRSTRRPPGRASSTSRRSTTRRA